MKPPSPRRAVATAVLAGVTLCLLSACGSGSDNTPSTAASAGNGKPVSVDGVTIAMDPALHALLPDSIKRSGIVRVASDVPYAPFEMFVSEGKQDLTGVDYDLGQALAGKLGVRFVFSEQKFDGIVPAIQAGRYDVAISAMTDNKARQQVLDFVDYSVSGSGILVVKGNPSKITTLDDLCGKTVAVQAATHQLDLLKAHQKACESAGRGDIGIQTYPRDTDAQLALRSGKVVADVLTKPAAGWTAKTADHGGVFELVDDPAATGGYDATPNGIGVSKRLPQLTAAIKKALQTLIDDGTVRKIYAKYGVASIAVAHATENSGKA